MAIQTARWHIYPDAEALCRKTVAVIGRAAAEALARNGVFHLVLAGGTTPRAVYQALRETAAQWDKWRIWFGDERCLPPRDAERNSHMARSAWLGHVPFAAGNIHVMPAELGAEKGAAAYAETLRQAPEFDLVLLGLGEDGHTASLFPGHPWGGEPGSPDALAVCDAPKPPSARISLSARRLSRARQVLFLVSGEAKREAVRRWREGVEIPAAAIAPEGGVDVLVESAAFGGY